MSFRFPQRLIAGLVLACPIWAHGQALTMALALGQAQSQAPVVAPQPSSKPFYREFWDDTVGSTSDLIKNGEWGVIVPVQTYHMPFAYTKEQRADQNNNPMPGLGISRGKYLANGNWASIYAVGFQESWDKPEWHLAYNYNWLWKTEGGVRYGLGATAGLMMRHDYANYAPVPFILPSFHLGYGRVSLEAAYVPGVKKGTANVALFWLRFQ